MTKVGIISDLHAEFLNSREPIRSIVEQKFNDINFKGLDVLCIAGDIDYQARSVDFIKKYILSKNKKVHVVFVMGNHDYWNGSIESTKDKLEEKTKKEKRIHFLQNSYVDLKGIRFIGATLWTDYNKDNELAKFEAKSRMNDFKKIRALHGQTRLQPNYLYSEHNKSKEFIFDTIEASTLPTIVVTHHKPYIGQGAVIDLVGYAFCSDLIPDLEKLNNKPLYWFNGHSHTHDEEDILGIKFRSNPLGYHFEYNTSNFNLDCNRVDI